MKEQLEKFIKNNKLTFKKGRRNTDLTIICGYTHYLGGCVLDLRSVDGFSERKNILVNVLDPYIEKDPELKEEFERLIKYTHEANYYKWWLEETNKAKYILD